MSDITIDDVKLFLLTKATADDLRTVVDYYKLRNKHLGIAAGLSFKYGDKVSFQTKTRGVITGTFVRQMSKNAIIKADNGVEWKVAPTILTKA